MNFELPSPAILEAHHALCKVLHASGTTEQMDKNLRDADEIVAQIKSCHEFSNIRVADLPARRLALVY